jgi:NAD-dependent deacetylase
MKFSDRLHAVVRNARSVCVLTGAGISAESGVPTFRGADGLWSRFKPEELANFDAFISNPELVWEWYSYRKTVMQNVKPNRGHKALVELEALVTGFTLVTQNVDNLHQRAGSRRVLELHGNIERSYCIDCKTFAQDVLPGKDKAAPRCEKCGGLLRPDVVWFGEVLPPDVFREAEVAAERCDLFLCVGTSGVVYPAAALPLRARQRGAFVVEINQEYTDLSDRMNETIIGKAGELLPELVELFRQKKREPS